MTTYRTIDNLDSDTAFRLLAQLGSCGHIWMAVGTIVRTNDGVEVTFDKGAELLRPAWQHCVDRHSQAGSGPEIRFAALDERSRPLLIARKRLSLSVLDKCRSRTSSRWGHTHPATSMRRTEFRFGPRRPSSSWPDSIAQSS